jgi:1,4-dihydroxy-2-naphthoate octaprenyltransferase
VPVLIGSGVALGYGRFSWWRALLALVVALALQVGVNFANDYSDGIRGSDERRVGPVRLVAAGLAPPRHVLLAALGCFGVAGVAGLALAAVTSWWLLAVGAACIAAAWFYTGGPKPYGYSGLGEVFVFLCFGVVAVAGTAYVQMKALTWLGLAASVPAGLLACALLMVNNLRDIGTDTVAGKRTLAVMLGDARSRAGYVLTLLVPFGIAALLAFFRPFTLLTVGPGRGVGSGADQGARPDRAAATGVRHRVHDRPGHPAVIPGTTRMDIRTGRRAGLAACRGSPDQLQRFAGSTGEISSETVRKWQDGTHGNGGADTGGTPPGRDPGGTRDGRITGSGEARMCDSGTLASLVRDT